MTTNVHDMNVLLACVNSYCQWANVKINMGKTEVEQIELQAKLLNYFLGSNKSNINQSQAMTINENALLISASFNSEMASLRQ